MAAEIVQINTQDFTSQTYGGQDTGLISSFEINTSLSSSSYIEYFIYDNNQNILSVDYNFNQYTIQNNGQSAGSDNKISEIIIDPEKALIESGFDQGEYITYFNFFNKQIGSELQQLYITEISSDRTEIRLDSTSLTDIDIVEQTINFVQLRNDSPYFLDFYLNFGDNQLPIANNIQLDNQDPNNPTVLIKLYEALPEGIDVNSTLWVVTLVEEPVAYKVTFEDTPIIITDTVPVKGPNFNLDLKDQVNNSTVSSNYTSLTTTTLTSSFNQLSSLLEEKEIDINIDYTDFNNFTHFSSVQARLENFYYKMSLLESYSSSISLINTQITGSTSSSLVVSGSVAVYESQINNVITNFDGYEYYLYYTSGSYAWPKTTSQPPYTLAKTGSNAVLTWLGSATEGNPYYGGMILSASIFDNLNQNNLYYTIPEYLREDPSNEPYQLFIEMVGQFYDNIWIYYKDVTEKYDADNRLENGVSKDIVADAIRDFGIKLYQNNFSNEDLYTAFLGLTPEGGLFPFPNITGSLPTPSGFEYINTLISASNDYMPLDDVNKSLYKRIYHNLPYLLKAKGTLPALRTLITSYGIPDTVLRITEFGGKDKVNTNDWDYWQDTFNYAYFNTGSNFVSTQWRTNGAWNSPNNVPATFEFRFKIKDLLQISGSSPVVLWKNAGNSRLSLEYTGSGFASGSYSGSIIDPYYQYANLIFLPDPNFSTTTASIYFPFCNEDWWSVMVTRSGSNFNLYAGNKTYEGGDNGTALGFYSSSYVSASDASFTDYSLDANFLSIGTEAYLQEIRYYNTVLSESVFKDYIMNPYSIEGNSINSSPDQLIFRLPLGGELYTGSVSIHPKVTGSWIATSSFGSNSTSSFVSTPTFVPNTEYFFYDQPVVGIKNAISDKIRLEDNTLPAGDTLSAIRALAQQPSVSSSYTANTNLLEVAFSPQDEINDDIMDQIGYFNIGDYIGDPRLRSSSATSYPDLDALRNAYFEKYTSNYDLNDFIRLIKFFDNSLFKMIKDFVPARTSLASGIVIKQHLLERNKYPQPQVEWEDLDISGTLKPTWNDYQEGTVEHFDGGAGGVFNTFNTVTNTSQSWYETIPTISGSVIMLHNSQDEFYDGEFSGSTLVVTTQSLAQAYPSSNIASSYKQVHYYGTSSIENTTYLNYFLNNVTAPLNGEILFYNEPAILLGSPTYALFNTKYLKIAKIDCGGTDNTNVLGNITKAIIFNDVVGTYVNYDLIVLNEFPTYYLYSSSPRLYAPGSWPNQRNYQVSASRTTPSLTINPGDNKSIQLLTESIDNMGYFTPSTGLLTFGNTPNTPITITTSLNLNSSANGNVNTITLIQNGNVNDEYEGSTILSKTFTLNSGANTVLFTGSFYPLNGDTYYLRLYNETSPSDTGTTTFNSIQLQFSQSRTVSSSNCTSVIFEPYITLPNYYSSDYNPLINNTEGERLSTKYQDVDYSTGISTPTNFGLIISGSAVKAAVQDSNYSSKRVILPRYEGSKSTSQHLNYWTPGDTGTYGKLPTVENLKTVVAYCDWIGGWPPDKMNASAIHVLYLIKSDGTVIIPNTSQNSLADIKGNFESGENILISSKTVSAGQPQQSRKIIRGGTRVEPILYNQSGSMPGGLFVSSITLTDNGVTGGVISDYQAKFRPTSYTLNPVTEIFTEIIFNQILSTGSAANAVLNGSGYRYKIDAGMISEGVSFYFIGELSLTDISISSGQSTGLAQIVRWRGGNKTVISNIAQTQGMVSTNTPLTVSAFVSFDDLLVNDEYAIEISSFYISSDIYVNYDSYFIVNQTPTPNSNTPVSNLWISSSTSTSQIKAATSGAFGNNLLFTTASALISYFNNPTVYQQDIVNSGFNPIATPWSIEYGDEFRFEGREDRVYQVKQAAVVNGSGLTKPLLVVEFNQPLPTSGSVNFDQFEIRRYVDDASQILMEGFKPTDSSGPYIVRPEYVVPELDKSVDQFILDLTQKGLIT
jgi:hypothetical protein